MSVDLRGDTHENVSMLPGAAATLIGILEVLVLTATGSAAHAATPATCDMRLRVVLTPDVPNRVMRGC